MQTNSNNPEACTGLDTRKACHQCGKGFCAPYDIGHNNLLESIVEKYKGFVPTVDPSEAVQRGLIHCHEKGKPLSLTNVLREACGWKTRIAERPQRALGPIGDFTWRGTTPSDAGKVQGQGEIDLTQAICATDPIGVYGGEAEAVQELAHCLSDEGKRRLGQVLTQRDETGGHSRQLLELETRHVLPIWRERMRAVTRRWRKRGYARIASAGKHLVQGAK